VEEFAKRYNFVEALFGIDEKDKAELLASAKALILPSSGETVSYTVLEAMASETPPVVSNAVPGDVVVDGFNGLRVNSLSPSTTPTPWRSYSETKTCGLSYRETVSNLPRSSTTWRSPGGMWTSSEGLSTNPRESLLSVRGVVEPLGDERVKNSYYVEFHRRPLVLELASRYCQGGRVVDVGPVPSSSLAP